MLKLNKPVEIVFLTFVVMILFGCSVEHKQKAPADVKPKLSSENVPIQETVNEQAQETKEDSELELSFQENPEAQQRLEFAENSLKMAVKGVLSYSQTVAICRSIIKDYPGTQYERQARMLLKQVPEDQRPQYNITDKELKL